MKSIVKYFLGFFLTIGTTSPAFAADKYEAWTSCLWKVAPVSTKNWIEMPIPEKYPIPGRIKPEYALKKRMDAACFDILIKQEVKRPLAISFKKLHKRLIASRPSQIPLTEENPMAFVCFRYFEDDADLSNPISERWGYGADLSQSQLGSSSLIFSGSKGDTALDPNGGLEVCKIVQTDGSLTDA